MGQPKKKSSLERVLKLVDELSPEERKQLRQKLDDKSWGDRWRKLEQEIEQNRIAKGLPPMTEEEVYAEFAEHRKEQKEKRAQGRH